MNGAPDLRRFLNSWPYDPDNNVRMAIGPNGRKFLVVRQPMGLETFEADGRPDGQRPHGMESALEFQVARFARAIRAGVHAAFKLTTADTAELFHEGRLYHDRFVHFFRAGDWARAERDTARNLRLIDFVRQHAENEEDSLQLEDWRPATTRIQAAARAMSLLHNEHFQEALHITRSLVAEIDGITGQLLDRPEKIAITVRESVRESLAICPTVRPRAESEFLRQGEYWTIRYEGQEVILKATRGLECLRYLLSHPGQEIHVSELLTTLVGAPPWALPGGLWEVSGLAVNKGRNDAGPMLDSKAKAEYKCRFDDLRRDVEEAERFNDPYRAASARCELDAIGQQLAAAVGLGGRDRRASSEAERARSAVTKRIRETINRIAEALPSLGRHLAVRIKTGYFCSYNPHPDRPVTWKF